MDCNKDEAVRAMELSEKKIQKKDYKGAKEMALKAQRLYPQLENISRLITVCEVHCSAENKVGGSEMDWYGILQIQQSDDEATIKKQYRKLGLILHPDKNRFAGAEAAFKLIGEANRVLADRGSRSKYDMKYSASLGPGTRSLGHQSFVNFSGPKHSGAASSVPQSRYTSVNLHQPVNVQQAAQPDSIRIACPSCKRMYDYNFASRLIFCQRCLGIFDASDLGPDSLGNQFPNGNAKVASAAEVGGASKTGKNGVGMEKHGVEWSESGPSKSNDSRNSRSMNRKRGDNSTLGSGESSKAGKGAKKVANPSEVSEHPTRKSSKSSKIGISFYENPNDSEDEDVGAVNVKDDVNVSGNATVDADVNVRENPSFNATRKRRVDASADGRVGRQTVLALPATDDYKKLGFGKQRVRRKRSNTDVIELQLTETFIADANGRKPVADSNGSKPVADSNGSKSVANSNSSNSMKDNNGRKPVAGSNGRKPVAGSNGRKPVAGSNGRKPVAGSNGRKPVAGSNGSKPVAGSNGSKPVEDSNGGKSMADYSGGKSMADYSGSKSMASRRKMVPGPEFNEFVLRKDVLQKTFKANQIWVLYDPADGMPRRYACIRKVLNPGFRVKITWLEPDPDDQGEVNWCRKKLPVACGKFGLALTEEVTDHTVFSHEYKPSTKGKDKGTFRIYPRKGETWALYQDWDLGWSSELEKHSQYKFDYVELLSDFSERGGAGVAHLGKVKGFNSLFEQAEQHGVVKFLVRPNELYRFSHQIPSLTMSGNEGYGVPAGCFEFDPAALPASMFDRRSIVTVAKPPGFIPSGRAHPASDRGEVKNRNLSDEPILID